MFPHRAARWIKTQLIAQYWRRLGKGIENPPIPRSPGSILFVCTGNICRSPFAEGYFRKIAECRNLREVRSVSAGLDVRISAPSPDIAVQVAKTFAVDMKDHRSKPITAEMVKDNDIIFAMEHHQAAILRQMFPNHRPKILLLPLFDSESSKKADSFLRYNIPDPFGKSQEPFTGCFRRIAKCMDGFMA